MGTAIPELDAALAGQGRARALLVVPGYGLAVALGAYAIFAAVLAVGQWGDPRAIFSSWTLVWGIAQFVIWVSGLAIATTSYARRTAR